jgi:hypothetical protein
MIVIRRTEGSADIRLANDELVMLNNALNEVCNGVEIADSEFQTRVGWDRGDLQELLAQINGLI